MILNRIEVTNFGTNCYIIGDDDSRDGMVTDDKIKEGAQLSALFLFVRE